MLRPFVHQQSLMLKDLEDLLESSLQKLKNDVAAIVKKKKKEYLLHTQQWRWACWNMLWVNDFIDSHNCIYHF